MSALFSGRLFGFVPILPVVAQRLFVIDLPIVVVNSFLLQWEKPDAQSFCS
jgi:hypothetical protein